MVITGLTRNQLYLLVPWVRIPPSPPIRRQLTLTSFLFNLLSNLAVLSIMKFVSGVTPPSASTLRAYIESLFFDNLLRELSLLLIQKIYKILKNVLTLTLRHSIYS